MGNGKTTIPGQKRVEQNHCMERKLLIRRYVLPRHFKVESSFKKCSEVTSKLYSKDFSMAEKTGTAAVNYAKDGGSGKYYASSLWVIFRLIILNILVL
jgi:hypothetical protein